MNNGYMHPVQATKEQKKIGNKIKLAIRKIKIAIKKLSNIA